MTTYEKRRELLKKITPGDRKYEIIFERIAREDRHEAMADPQFPAALKLRLQKEYPICNLHEFEDWELFGDPPPKQDF